MKNKANSLVKNSFYLMFFTNSIFAATFELGVNFSDSLRLVTQCASGSLYGITETLPSEIENLVAPLKPRMFAQPALSGNGRQQPIGAAIPVAQRLKNTTAKVQIRLADVLPGWPYKYTNQSSWLNAVTSVINDKKASGLTNFDGYEIWNEPYGTWQNANGDFHSQLWKPTYDLIRSKDPSARIIGPSFAFYSSSRMEAFLTYCKNNNCLPDVISWHQWGSGGFKGAHDNYRALETKLGISPRAISINEYSSTTHIYEGSPGVSVPFIAKFERYKIESASISWWFTNLPGRLGSLLTANNQKGGGWWLYKWYGDMTGHMVKTTPPNDNSEGVDGFASLDKNAKYASVVIGGNSIGTVNVNVNGLPTIFGSKVNVKLEYVTWADKDTAVPNTNLISNTEYNVSGGKISVPVNVTNQFYAYRLYITPVQSNASPVVKLTSPKIDSIYTSPATISIAATASDIDGTIAKVQIYNGNNLLVSKNSAPYDYSWSNVQPGVYTIKAIATDNSGNTSQDTILIRVNVPQTPYNGTSWAIPGTIQFEEFDKGGNGSAYFDNSPGSETAVHYRTDEDVDIEVSTDVDGGYNIGYATAGEWLEYTTNVTASGPYTLTLRAASNEADRTISLTSNGSPIATDIVIPNSGGWQMWQDVVVPNVTLSAGEQVIRATVGPLDYVNLNYMTFTYDGIVASNTRGQNLDLSVSLNSGRLIVRGAAEGSRVKVFNLNGDLVSDLAYTGGIINSTTTGILFITLTDINGKSSQFTIWQK